VKKFGSNLSDLDIGYFENSSVAESESFDLMTIFDKCTRLSDLSIYVCSNNAKAISHCAKDLSKLHFADLKQ
jgi:hypothetical protein